MKPQFLTGVSKTPSTTSSVSSSSSLNTEQKKLQSTIKTLIQEFGKLLTLFLNDSEEMNKLLFALKNSYQTMNSIQKTLKHSDYYRSHLFNINDHTSKPVIDEDNLTKKLYNKIFQEIEYYFLQLRQFSKRLSDDLLALNLKYAEVVKVYSQESIDSFTDTSSPTSFSSFVTSSTNSLFIFTTEHLADLCQILKMVSMEKFRKISLLDSLFQLHSSSPSSSSTQGYIPTSPSFAILGVIDFTETEKILEIVIDKWEDHDENYLDDEQIQSFIERNNIKNL